MKIFQILPFPTTFFDFHPPKFLMTFFSYRLKILNFSPIFAVSVHFPLSFTKITFSPTLKYFPPDFIKFTCFLHALCFSLPPCFDPDAFMHHIMHVLDAPGFM